MPNWVLGPSAADPPAELAAKTWRKSMRQRIEHEQTTIGK
jgi:hypothetical protein